MTQIIKPTVGRKVWYRPSAFDLAGPGGMTVAGSLSTGTAAPLDATVIAVWGDRMVNLLVTDIAGRQFPKLSVDLVQPGDEPRVNADGLAVGGYAEWMPYQAAQAAKESAAAESVDDHCEALTALFSKFDNGTATSEEMNRALEVRAQFQNWAIGNLPPGAPVNWMWLAVKWSRDLLPVGGESALALARSAQAPT